MRTLLLILVLVPALVRAEVVHLPETLTLAGPMVADVSQAEVQIHASFTGTQLLIFGARNAKGDLVIAVRGPQAKATLRRKERIAGMWMHVEKRKYYHLPLFYGIAATRPLKDIAPRATLQRLGLGERQVVRQSNQTNLPRFDEALQTYMHKKGRWQEPFSRISYFGESLFKARLNMPSSLPAGAYTVEVYLFDNGQPVAFQTIPVRAYKTGVDAGIYRESREHPFLYGLLAIGMALFVGWLAHRLFYRR